MIRATLLTCLLASPIAADTIHLREHPSAMAELFYRNDPAQNSVQGETRHEVNGIAELEKENAQLRADCAKWEKMARAAMNVAVDAYDVPSAAQQDKG
ncbi:hypothetical protein [Dinoroseobacter sp. S375]|uniref:hypothetical protein n=1 Tax=Dinoroseobacter sp. S375 TaxID=3415136 RepID=UPI003C7A285A